MSDEINKKNIDEDYNTSRDTLRDLLDKGQQSMDLMIRVAEESEHPRAFEVLSNLMKNLADISNQLMELNKKTKEVKQDPQPNNQLPAPGEITNNYMFTGSTAQLQQFIEDQKKEQHEKIIDVGPESNTDSE